MKFTRSAKFALAVAASAAMAVSLLTPAQANTRSTVAIYYSNPLTGFNASTPKTNLVTNADAEYLQFSGFAYYNDKGVYVPNTTFGSYRVSKSAATDFRTSWTVNPGRVWSDGTPITGADLLFGHILASSDYSKDAGLGDPITKKDNAFDSLSYGSTYDTNIKGISISGDTVTLSWPRKMPNWELLGVGPAPVHAYVLLAEGKSELGSASENLAAKARFLKAFQDKDSVLLKKIAAVWNKDYTIADVSSKTNPLLFVGNGGYLVDAAVKGQSVTFKKNPRYNSGPKLSGAIDTIIFRFLSDGTAAAQALANGELDIYEGQATVDGVAKLKATKGVAVFTGSSAVYEHIDINMCEDSKSVFNPLVSGEAKARALREAFLLAIPREEILDKLVRPIAPTTPILRSSFSFPGMATYDKTVVANGSARYMESQDVRTKRALALVKKYYPKASATNPGFTVSYLFGNPDNTRRVAQSALIKAAVAKAGINLNVQPQTGWGGKIGTAPFDVAGFAWSKSSDAQFSTNPLFDSNGGNNYSCWNNPTIDKLLLPLAERTWSNTVLSQIYTNVEREINKQSWTLPIFRHPLVLGYNEKLQNVSAAPFSPNIIWNYWEWTYKG